ncbi:hypothetical protein INS49_012548 [Diaporthe citri]|uniref:uncharacterized protein n=1 Tax=Diaporthe citri TaxID=83186 RepID=UPI001C7EF55D|nr:uncharacterized protein INS49_012548 [Diaporthe citri]KAG6359028.1 hypothetical protein INS49_012548 [Diaporthe citri]
MIETVDTHGMSDTESFWLASALFAGAETSSGALSWWLHAMLLNPEAQRRAHKELDRVIGRERVPTFDDVPKLPYLRATMMEVMRIRPVDPVGLPHCLSEDTWYEGYFLPKGAILVANVWAVNRDPTCSAQMLISSTLIGFWIL